MDSLNALERLFARLSQDNPCWRYQPDSDWPSPCEGDGRWHPVKRDTPADFTGLEAALGLTLHPSIKAYFGHYFMEYLKVSHARGEVELLGAWNEQDFERLQQNLIGHVLMKRRLNQPVTLFIACTDDDNFMLSVDNQSGEVVLEPVGQPAQDVLAPSLAAFLDSLTESPS
ncbi:SecY-interacting protein [Gallaecimonas xiamenensis]|uniref:SecY interacting protein Syd n=1 Tax=Gallaecimonas xiamenensis 3-C-1 TaxID=745411 RepID=K2K9R6_9GAMM|nr:SecY-interacting protein [Gallaecimonas xiamenensis]EKE74050.1 SecY interacting protein Syd [Gallaecimonas xiamenensis 3-C-1]